MSVPSSAFATAMLTEFVRCGVRDVVVCPGSRSQALALAAAAAERAETLRLHVRVDERSAAYFALGIARETARPVPVIVTSGTAVANLLPAALEAHEGRVPLLLLTADRPAEMRGTRSNQATHQTGLFDAVARLTVDIDVDEFNLLADDASGLATLVQHLYAAALGSPGAEAAGPVQVNLQFREPLSGLSDSYAFAAQDAASEAEDVADVTDVIDQRPVYTHEGDALTVVIAGESAGREAEEFARLTGLPLLAEVVSGSRFGRESISAYATLIDHPDIGLLIERAVVFGHPTLTRQIPELLQRDDVEVVVVDPHTGPGHYDPSGTARVVREVRVSAEHDPRGMRRWLGVWVEADRALLAERTTVHEPDLEAARANGYKERNAYARAELVALREAVTRELLVESVWRATWPHDRLVLASSRLVRVLDKLAPSRRVEVRSNRGLAGIDGTVATALGVATASQSQELIAQAAGVTRVMIGDLALLHDVGSLLMPESEPRPRIQLFVGNDGGGSIFDLLEVAKTANPEDFDRVMFTPQRVRLKYLADAYGWEYRLVSTRGELEALLTEPVTGPSIVEVPLAR